MARRRGSRRGTRAIFTNKDRGSTRYQGVVNEAGRRGFEEARRTLAAMAGRETASDGDTMIALAIGWEAVEEYLASHGR